MVKVIDKIKKYVEEKPLCPYFSFEFFPPKTEAGVENLYLRMERMTSLQPIFIDVTWGAGGITKPLTMGICEYSQKYFGTEVMMHLTCAGLSREKIVEILKEAKSAGITNILALRGDPPKGAPFWIKHPQGLDRAVDLVKLIRSEFGDFFGIAVAGFPEGYPNSRESLDVEIAYLKEKIEAGADFVLTQFFYDTQIFLKYVNKCRAAGISCPIIPGMMPIQSYSSFQRMTSFCGSTVPAKVWEDLKPIRENDEAVKSYGVELSIKMCGEMIDAGIQGFHFYTLNLENSVLNVLKFLGIGDSDVSRRNLPFRGSRCNLTGMVEDVRPINWANRPKSYIARTNQWDEYPNGRWGDSRSPAFGELSNSHFFGTSVCTKRDRLMMWGDAPIHERDLGEVFASYVEGRIPILPWCETPLALETSGITWLGDLNRKGFFTINSQPSINAVRSDDSVFGWGGGGGRVYQKSYVEFFTSPKYLKLLLQSVNLFPTLTLHAIDSRGEMHASHEHCGTAALTWGVFPNKEILQPTVFNPETFTVWSKEAFQLWIEAWAVLYDDETDSCGLIHQVYDTYFLVAIYDNEFIDNDFYAIFRHVLKLIEKEWAERDDEVSGGIEL